MGARLLTAIAAAAIATAAAPRALAQGSPTPENAQKFIAQMLLGARAGEYFDNKMADVRVTQGVSGTGCNTTVRSTPDGDGNAYTYQIDWRRIRGATVRADNIVTIEGAVHTLRGNTGNYADYPRLAFNMSAPEAAKRVHSAFEVLRRACEPAGGLGF